MTLPQHVPHNTGIIDDVHARRYCRIRRVADQPRGQHQAPPPAVPTTDPNFQNFFNYICDQNDAGFRVMTAVHESIYRSQTQQPVMTPPQFLTYVDWPGVRPTFSGGGGAGADAEQAASDASMEEGDGNDDVTSD
ncbi:hypothetical protein A2U01_0047635 [Trifolium medium]|uniref:Uncharacterized protein n=1 Tax=Trifolium medium TaxID=97028 RepID=A0A392QS44_9FABA|nr:hypothetical protein [Trifolium medium]